MSLVLVSPSTLTMFSVSSTACLNVRSRNAGSTEASVVTKANIVAMFG